MRQPEPTTETIEITEVQRRFAVIDRMRAAFADVSTEEIEREVAKAVTEVRAEMEAERSAAGCPTSPSPGSTGEGAGG